MITRTKRIVHATFICLVVMGLLAFNMPTQCFGEGISITIDVAPATLNIQSDGVVVTVHTDIAYSYVDFSSVYLNGVAINSSKIDNCGFFVAKFLMDEIKALEGLIIGDYNTLTLVGVTTSGDSFIGTQDIMVIDVVPNGKL